MPASKPAFFLSRLAPSLTKNTGKDTGGAPSGSGQRPAPKTLYFTRDSFPSS
jgi:hypothetical protein